MEMTFCFKLIHYLKKTDQQMTTCIIGKEILLKYNLMRLVSIFNKQKYLDSTTSSENYFKSLIYLILSRTQLILSYMINFSS